jgi:hypothetical protein
VNRKVKTKIRFNGREYSDPSELPPKARAAYNKAMSEGAAKKRILVNGTESSNQSDVPGDAQKVYDDVLSVIENNGEVTLPGFGQSESHVTKRQLQFVLLVAGAVLSAVWRLVKR